MRALWSPKVSTPVTAPARSRQRFCRASTLLESPLLPVGVIPVTVRQVIDASLPPQPPPAPSSDGALQLASINATRKRLFRPYRVLCQRLIVLCLLLSNGRP